MGIVSSASVCVERVADKPRGAGVEDDGTVSLSAGAAGSLVMASGSAERLRDLSTLREVRRRFRAVSSSFSNGFGRMLLGSTEPPRWLRSLLGELEPRSIGPSGR